MFTCWASRRKAARNERDNVTRHNIVAYKTVYFSFCAKPYGKLMHVRILFLSPGLSSFYEVAATDFGAMLMETKIVLPLKYVYHSSSFVVINAIQLLLCIFHLTSIQKQMPLFGSCWHWRCFEGNTWHCLMPTEHNRKIKYLCSNVCSLRISANRNNFQNQKCFSGWIHSISSCKHVALGYRHTVHNL